MKKAYQNPQTNEDVTIHASMIMTSPYADLEKGGSLGGLNVPRRKLPWLPR